MTCREALEKEIHDSIDDKSIVEGRAGCPSDRGYLSDPDYCQDHVRDCRCTLCWDREIPGTESTKLDTPWEQILKLVEDAAEKRDRSVSLYFNPGTGMSVSVYPWPDAEDLYEMYQKGRITANDFRAKMGLPMVKNAEQFMKRDPSTEVNVTPGSNVNLLRNPLFHGME